ncbi:MAG TPA: RnfABCDGE type electron transport complex subunit D [Planctomycetota bacterium]|nr:RnfABCDGE type electron transport complex subunit D [Planctomycetota bacterium]
MYPTQLHSYLLWRSTVTPDPQSLASRRYTATVSLLPATMVGIFVFGWWASWILFLSVLTAFATDLLTHRFIYKDSPGTRDGTWMLTGLLLGLLMPPDVPWFFPVIGSSVAVFLGKHYLSVDGMPLLQPAAVGLLTLQLLGVISLPFMHTNPMQPSRAGKPVWPVLARGIEPSSGDAKSAPNAVGKLWLDFLGGDVRKAITRKEYREAVFDSKQPVFQAVKNKDGKEVIIEAEAVYGSRPMDAVKANPSKSVGKASGDGAERYDWVDMFLGYVPAQIGASSGLALAFGILLLLFTGAVSPLVPLFAYMTLFAGLHFLSWIYGNSADAPIIAANIPIHLLSGSTILGIFYLAADPTTAPRSVMGKVYAGVALGVIEIILRIFTPLTEGIFLSIILVQALSFVIDQWLAPPLDEQQVSSSPGITSSSLGRL